VAVRFNSSAPYTATTGLPSGDLTITCWAYQVTNRADYSCIWSMENGPTSASQYFQLITGATGDGVGLYYTGSNLSAAYTVTAGTWNQFAVTLSGTTATLYAAAAAGPLAQIATGTIPAVSKTNLFIGSDSYGEWWNGRVAAFKAWNAALTLTQMQAEMLAYDAVVAANRVHKLQVPETTDYSGNGFTLSGGSGATTEADPPITVSSPPRPPVIRPSAAAMRASSW
jgi:hypothetical protein